LSRAGDLFAAGGRSSVLTFPPRAREQSGRLKGKSTLLVARRRFRRNESPTAQDGHQSRLLLSDYFGLWAALG